MNKNKKIGTQVKIALLTTIFETKNPIKRATYHQKTSGIFKSNKSPKHHTQRSR